MSFSIGSMRPDYQSTYTSSLYRGVDRNYDNSYSKQEVSNFAKSYEKSTGEAIDVDGLFKAYDVDVDGALSSTEYKKLMADDAMNMDVLFGAKQKPSEPAKQSSDEEMTSWLNSLKPAQKISLVRSTFRAETTTSLLNAMFGGGNPYGGARVGGFNMGNVLMQYNSARLNGYMSRISSFSRLI